MKTNNSIRIVILVFFLLATFLMAAGCRRTPSETEQAISKKWEHVISGEDTEVKKVEIKKYTMQPGYSSIAATSQKFTSEDPATIKSLIGIVRGSDVSFEDFEFDTSGMEKFHNSHMYRQTIQIALIDSAGKEILGLYLYENGDIVIVEPREATETKKTYRPYLVYFENSNTDVFAAFDGFYENNFTE